MPSRPPAHPRPSSTHPPHSLQEREAASRQALLAVSAQLPEAALAGMESAAQGLSAEVAAERLRRWGPNAVGQRAEAGLLRQLLQRLANPLNILLLALSGVSVLSGNAESAVIIFLIFALAAILAAYDLFWWFVLRAIQGFK